MKRSTFLKSLSGLPFLGWLTSAESASEPVLGEHDVGLGVWDFYDQGEAISFADESGGYLIGNEAGTWLVVKEVGVSEFNRLQELFKSRLPK